MKQRRGGGGGGGIFHLVAYMFSAVFPELIFN